VNPKLGRLVWSESDGLPGVIIDRYGDYLVLQTLTLAMTARISSSPHCGSFRAPKAIIKVTRPHRKAEGMEPVTGASGGPRHRADRSDGIAVRSGSYPRA